MRTTREALPSSPNFYTKPAGGHLTHDVRFHVRQFHVQGVSSVKSGLKPETFRPQSRTTRRQQASGEREQPSYSPGTAFCRIRHIKEEIASILKPPLRAH
ncbi:hypothetical protein AVEN_75301-1 [Araneus ventricosus]|uniref:Uncharacterized protein n=1 Tax=Araneus ventricosus TaxID=182803 RepID=A0A4Y2G7I8_ARAVE|nr:hypothetical protein AVEN_75301-1 [Araneus ventricosus]